MIDDGGGINGDYSKFGLGALSLGFDAFFLAQHYILYPGRPGPEETEALLPCSDSSSSGEPSSAQTSASPLKAPLL